MEERQQKLDLSNINTRVLMNMLNVARAHGYYRHSYRLIVTVEELKEELAKREHVPNKTEAKQIRRDRAKQKKNFSRKSNDKHENR